MQDGRNDLLKEDSFWLSESLRDTCRPTEEHPALRRVPICHSQLARVVDVARPCFTTRSRLDVTLASRRLASRAPSTLK